MASWVIGDGTSPCWCWHVQLNSNGRITDVDVYNTGVDIGVVLSIVFVLENNACVGRQCNYQVMLCVSLISSFARFQSRYPVLVTYLHHKCCAISEKPFEYGLKRLCVPYAHH